MSTSFYSDDELSQLGLASFGKNILISKKCSIYSPQNITIGNNVRIDDFCILSGTIELGNYIHISAYSALYGAGGIFLDDYSGVSPRCTIFSATDDFSGEYLIGPQHSSEKTNVIQGKVHLKKFTQLGSNTVVLPNLTIAEGAVTGAMTLVNKDLAEWSIYMGAPAKKIKERKKDILNKI